MDLSRGIVAAAGVALALGSDCRRSAPPRAETPLVDVSARPLKQPADVRLTCAVERAGKDLRLRFEIQSAAREPIHVYDGRGREGGLVQLVADGGGAAVHLVVGIPPLPPFPTAWRFAPKATELLPGAELRREVVLALPLREAGSYYRKEYPGDGTVKVERLVLRVDFLRASRMSPQAGPPEKAEALFGDEESVSCEASLPGPVDLERRGDPFTRI
jgi:hypothetical protein